MTTSTRIPFQTVVRQASIDLLIEFRQEFDIRLQVYPARPLTINPPCSFVDRMREAIAFDGMRQRTVQADIIIVWGLFDSAEAAVQRDDFVDNFVDWVTDRYHAAGATTVIEPRSIEDDPTFIPEWLPPDRQKTYFATRFTLEGFAGGY
jgi:uncharacterized Fe-S center protein